VVKRLSIKGKLLVLMAVFVVGFVGFGAYAYYNRGVVQVNGPLYQSIVQGKDLAADTASPSEHILEAYLIAFQVLEEPDHAKLDELLERSKALREAFEARHDFWMNELPEGRLKEKLLVEAYKPAFEFFEIRDKEFIPAILKTDLQTAADILHTRLHEKYEEHRAKIDEVVAMAKQRAKLDEQEGAEVIRKGTVVFLSVALLITAVVLALGWQIGRGIVQPLDRTVEVLEGVATGDLTRRLEFDSSDEVGRMARALDQAVDGMRNAIEGIVLNAQALAGASEELASVSQQMSSNADETASQAAIVSAASEQVNRNVETVATGAEEMSASIKEIAKNASEAARIAISAVKAAEVTNATVAKLGESSAEIGKVSKVITSIAEQTNLLALNATIEAARAGEAGKGFAVVANEVKELAKETAKATEDISVKIQAIQSDTRSAVTAIEGITGIINQINDISSTIASAVEEQSVTTSEIGRNVVEAAKGSGEITRNVTGVARAAQSTTAGAADMQEAARELARMAAEMQRLVGRFKILQEEAAGPRTPAKPGAWAAGRGHQSDGRALGAALPLGA